MFLISEEQLSNILHQAAMHGMKYGYGATKIGIDLENYRLIQEFKNNNKQNVPDRQTTAQGGSTKLPNCT